MGCFPETHELSLKMLGMHGTVYANYAMQNCDLIIALGVGSPIDAAKAMWLFYENPDICFDDLRMRFMRALKNTPTLSFPRRRESRRF